MCADADARLPLPVNEDQTRLYRVIFDELGANSTVALRLKSGFIDIESGEAPSYNKLNDPMEFVGMTSTANGETEWTSYSKAHKVYTVCEKTTCQPVQQLGITFFYFLIRLSICASHKCQVDICDTIC